MRREFPIHPAPHLPAGRSVRGLMQRVLLALLPGVAMHSLVFGPGVLLQITLAAGFAWLLEALMLRLRGVAARGFLSDLSAPLTGALFALCLPPLAPWWIALVGMIAAVVVAKHLYGGLGYNLFNPAMVGYATVLLCFPRELTLWHAPQSIGLAGGWSQTLASVFAGQPPIDALAQATPLDQLRELSSRGFSLGEILQRPLFAANPWPWIAAAYLLGGLYLLWARVIAWQVPTAALLTCIALTAPAWLLDADLYPSPLWHLGSGALMLAAFFIATDPVSGCTTPRGRLLFGAGVALLTLAIRQFGNYPDGVAFAVLLMNAAAPWIDLHTRPRIVGEPQ